MNTGWAVCKPESPFAPRKQRTCHSSKASLSGRVCDAGCVQQKLGDTRFLLVVMRQQMHILALLVKADPPADDLFFLVD